MTDPAPTNPAPTNPAPTNPAPTNPAPTNPAQVSPEQVSPEQMSFEQLVSGLETLTDRLASGQIGIEEAAELYEEAERLHGLATERLARVQARIDALASPPAAPPSR